MRRRILAGALLATLMAATTGAQAALITITLGNSAPGFADGATPTVPQIAAAQAGQPPPFDAGKGSDIGLGPNPNLSESWTFNFAAIADPILSVDLILGIVDHDSAATGSQLALYELDNNPLTAALDALFEGSGGGDQEYNVYTVSLANALFGDVADGSVTIDLDLQGPGLVFDLLQGIPVDSAANGAFLIFSELVITTQDGQPVPEPTTLSLAALGLGLLAWRRRRGTHTHSV